METMHTKSQAHLLSDVDVYLFHEGTLQRAYNMLGAHLLTIQQVTGVRFAVWAPNALSVSVVGDFNSWDGSLHQMERIKQSGIWVLFIPGLEEGDLYKYKITTPEHKTLLKADPYAFFSEKRPNTASVVQGLAKYDWQDKKWMKSRAKKDLYHSPMLIYEVHLGSWRKKENGDYLSYQELAEELIDYVTTAGYTHIELLPVMEHPYDRSWGYQITGYYSVTSRFGTPEDFMYLIDQCHQKGIGVILDWVPVHFCKDEHGLGRFDGTPLYEPIDPMKAERPHWGTYSFDYEKREVISFLISNALFWFDVYHIDGLRVDAVSSMIYLDHDRSLPVPIKNKEGGEENLEAIAFTKKLNEVVYQNFPNVLMIAEEATAWPLVSAPTSVGGLGFSHKWNMGWVNDVLRYMTLDERERSNHHNLLTFSFFYAFSENFILPFSHDEIVYGKRSLLNKMPGDYWQKFANLRLLYGYFITHPGKKLTFMGSEFAQFDEWKSESELDWNLFDFESHRNYYQFLKALHYFYKNTSCLWRLDHEQEGFEWINPHDSVQSVISFMRKGKQKGDYCLVVCNFSSRVYHHYRIGVPSLGSYLEIFNSDVQEFGGSGQLNETPIKAEKHAYNHQTYSMEITVPPLGITIFKKQKSKRGRRRNDSK